MDTVRSFVAIELDPDLKRALSAVQEALRSHLDDGPVRWTRPEGVHLTLKFLGEVSADGIAEIAAQMDAAAREVDGFRIELKGVGGFPTNRSPRVVWVGVEEPSGSLSLLQRQVEDRLEPLGFPKENRPFSPHLTIGRARGRGGEPHRRLGRALEALDLSPQGAMEVRTISLMRSQLGPEGAAYSQLAQSKLGLP